MSDNYDGPAMAQQILRLRAERDALKAEIAVLVPDHANAMQAVSKLMDDLQAAEAKDADTVRILGEVMDELNVVRHERDAALQKVELQTYDKKHQAKQIVGISKERDVLRTALEKIVDANHEWCVNPEDLKEIARAAIDAARSKT